MPAQRQSAPTWSAIAAPVGVGGPSSGAPHHDSAGSLPDDVVPRDGRALAVGAEGGGARVDETGIQLRQGFVVEAEALHRTGAHVAHHHTYSLHEAQHNLAPLGAAHIERHTVFAPVMGNEIGAWVARRTTDAATTLALAMLDLDDLGTHVASRTVAYGPC